MPALWTWDTTTNPAWPVVKSFIGGSPTKSGVTPADVIALAGVPLVITNPTTNVSTPVSLTLIQNWIRAVEDRIEQDVGIRLCQTWIAASPIKSSNGNFVAFGPGANGANNSLQSLGVDYDLEEPGYDFNLKSVQDEGWGNLKLRWKPLKGPASSSPGGVQSYAFTYPLLAAEFAIPTDWLVEDPDYGYIRLVPSRNVQLLPLLQFQFNLLGFARSLPAALQLQYVAGLSPSDYSSDYSFVTLLVQYMAVAVALANVQGSVNFGVVSASTSVDGLARTLTYDKAGAYAGIISTFASQATDLMKQFKTKVGGLTMRFL